MGRRRLSRHWMDGASDLGSLEVEVPWRGGTTAAQDLAHTALTRQSFSRPPQRGWRWAASRTGAWGKAPSGGAYAPCQGGHRKKGRSGGEQTFPRGPCGAHVHEAARVQGLTNIKLLSETQFLSCKHFRTPSRGWWERPAGSPALQHPVATGGPTGGRGDGLCTPDSHLHLDAAR